MDDSNHLQKFTIDEVRLIKERKRNLLLQKNNPKMERNNSGVGNYKNYHRDLRC